MRLRRVLLPATLGVAGYFALFGGEHNALELWRLSQQGEREAVELEALKAEVARLRARSDSLATDTAALERLARERLGMIKEGERLYRFAPTDDSVAPDAEGRR